jgi:hypothetical protein
MFAVQNANPAAKVPATFRLGEFPESKERSSSLRSLGKSFGSSPPVAISSPLISQGLMLVPEKGFLIAIFTVINGRKKN